MRRCLLTILAGFFSLTLVFGEEFLIEDFNSTPQKTWKFWNGNEFPGAEGHFEILSKNGTDKCGKLSFDFSKGGAYVSAECQLHDDRWKESDPLTGITFDLFKPEGVRVKIRLTDSSNQTFQKEIRAASDRWSKAYTSLDFWEDSWGGKNDRIFHGLPTRLSILADKLQIKRGEILFDNIRLSSGVQENEVQLEHSFRKIVPAQSWWCENGEWKPDTGELKLKFSQNKHSASLNFPARTLPGTPKKIILRGKGSVDGLKVTFHTHTHFMTFLKRDISPTAANDGFEFVTATPPGNDWNWAGGENDGKIHGPMRLGRIDFVSSQTGEIDLKDVDIILVTTAPNDSILMQYAETLSDNENIHFIWNGQVVSSKAIKGDLVCTLKNWNGETLQETKRSITIPGDLDKTSETFTFPVPQKLNFVEACFIFSAPGLNEDEIYSTWLGDFPRNTDFTKDMDSPFGMGVYLYRLPMDQMETVARKAAEAGVKWTREEFNWSILQPRRGDYNWAHFDHLVDVAEKYGIQVYGITAYWSGWTKPYTEEGIQEYLEYLKACVTRYKGRIHHWEIWNEPNIFFWQGPKEMYTDLLRRCYQMIKEIDPDIQVLGLSTAGIDFDFIETNVKKEAPFDILTIHPYRSILAEDTFIEDLQKADKLVQMPDGSHRPIWNTEIGWATHTEHPIVRQDFVPHSERKQAELLARTHLTTIASGVNPKNFWYNFRNDGNDPWYFEFNMGITRQDFSPKPAYAVFSTMTSILKGTSFKELETREDNTYIATFEGSRKQVKAVWNPQQKITLSPEDAEFACDIKMNAIGELLPSQKIIVPKGPPVYLISNK